MNAQVSLHTVSEKQAKSNAFDCDFDEVAFGAKINESPIFWNDILFSSDAANVSVPISIGHVVFDVTKNKPVKFFSDLLAGGIFIEEAINKDELSFETVVMCRKNFEKVLLAFPKYASILTRIRPVFQDNCSTYDLKIFDETYEFLCMESVDLSSATAVALALLSALALGRSGNKRDKQLLAVCETAKKRLLHDDCLSPA